MERRKILFIAEGVTLAHVGRPLALAHALDPQRFDIHFACTDGYEFCFKDSGFRHWPIHSISSARFLQALASGKPVYDEATLVRYVEDDLRLLDGLGPDLVVGDFRLSLSVSARLAKVPYVALSNAYWSPYVEQHYRVPNIPLTRIFPIPIADALFRAVRPLAFAMHAQPLNRIRRTFGLASLGPDLRRIYTDADHTAYADIPQLFPAQALPASHSYLGPVIWSPPLAPPPWWDSLPGDKPIVYVTLGSSGQGRLLPRVLQALAPLPLTVLAATAGKASLGPMPPNVYAADFLPGAAAARRAALVVCNGGSPTCQQALAAGVPVLGIAGNLDQFLNMHGVAAAGAGILLRADRLGEAVLQDAVKALLRPSGATEAAKKIALAFSHFESGARFKALLPQLFRE
ncbi:MAG TPA: glycosyltransferase [Janthinobacterium sp.]|nr:glycosyltransferase [Janthinobacterium sp.]